MPAIVAPLIVLVVVCAAVFLGAGGVRPFVVGCIATSIPPFLILIDLFKGQGDSIEDRLNVFLTWGLLASMMWAVPAFLLGLGLASFGRLLAKDHSSGGDG